MDVIGKVLITMLAAYGSLYLFTAIGAPKWFLTNLALSRADKKHPTPHWFWPLAIATALALSVLVYAGTYAIVAAVPYSWGGHNEDGDWETTRDSIRGLLTFLGTIGLLSKLDGNAKMLVSMPVERQARLSLQSALRQARIEGQDARGIARRKVSSELAARKFEATNAHTEYRDDVRGEILRDLAD